MSKSASDDWRKDLKVSFDVFSGFDAILDPKEKRKYLEKLKKALEDPEFAKKVIDKFNEGLKQTLDKIDELLAELDEGDSDNGSKGQED